MTEAPTDGSRAAGYDVLAQLLEHGAAGVEPGLASVFDRSADPADLRSEFVAAFDLGIPPYASAFLEADRCVGSRVTAAIGDRMGSGGGGGLAACHIAAQLGHVSALLVHRRGEQARAFVHDVVLAWLPAFSIALDEQPVPFWRMVVRQTLDLAAEHAGAAPPGLDSAPLRPAEVDSPLGERSGLADIGRWLAAPAAVGTFISDADLVGIGRTLELPRGFGNRAERIETLLRSAVEYGLVPRLSEGMAGLLSRRREAMTSLGQTHLHAARLEPWTARIDRALAVVDRLGDAAASALGPSDAPR